MMADATIQPSTLGRRWPPTARLPPAMNPRRSGRAVTSLLGTVPATASSIMSLVTTAARHLQTAAWAGSEMIVWGGQSGISPNYIYWNDGGRYNPAGNSWTAVATTNAPAGRYQQTAVWTGSEMIVWGGASNTTYY